MAGSLMPPPSLVGDIPGVGIVSDIVGGAAGWAWDQVTGGLTSWVLGAVAGVVHGVVAYLEATTESDPSALWFSGPGSPFASVRSIAFALLVAFVLLAIIAGLIRGDGPGTVAHLAVTLPGAVLAIGTVTILTSKLLALTDALAAGVLAGGGGGSLPFLARFGDGAVNATGGFAIVTIGLIAVLGGLAVWVELMVRAALVYVLVALSPLAFAAMVWPAMRGLVRRLIELLIAVIAAKLVIAVTLAVGVAAFEHTAANDASGQGVGTMLVGAAILALSAFAPFLVLRLFPVVEAAVIAHGISRAPLRATRSAMSAAVTASSITRLAGPAGDAARDKQPFLPAIVPPHLSFLQEQAAAAALVPPSALAVRQPDTPQPGTPQSGATASALAGPQHPDRTQPPMTGEQP